MADTYTHLLPEHFENLTTGLSDDEECSKDDEHSEDDGKEEDKRSEDDEISSCINGFKAMETIMDPPEPLQVDGGPEICDIPDNPGEGNEIPRNPILDLMTSPNFNIFATMRYTNKIMQTRGTEGFNDDCLAELTASLTAPSGKILYLDRAYTILTEYLAGNPTAKLLDRLHVLLRDYNELLIATSGIVLPITIFLVDIGLKLPDIFDHAMRSILDTDPPEYSSLAYLHPGLVQQFKRDNRPMYRTWGDMKDELFILLSYIGYDMNTRTIGQLKDTHKKCMELLEKAKDVYTTEKPAKHM